MSPALWFPDGTTATVWNPTFKTLWGKLEETASANGMAAALWRKTRPPRRSGHWMSKP